MEKLKIFFITFLGACISFFTDLQIEIQALLVFMIVDYITGILVALYFKNSTKTETGAYSANAGYKGLVKKILIIFLLLVLFYCDKVLETNLFLTTGVIGFAINEIASIIENVGLTGLDIPKALKNALDLLKSREDKGE